MGNEFSSHCVIVKKPLDPEIKGTAGHLAGVDYQLTLNHKPSSHEKPKNSNIINFNST
jgi:hypothetical protein